MKLKAKALLAGLATWIPGYDAVRTTGGTDSARYCYSVWLRHLVLARECGHLGGVPKSVAELGPGDSIGIGLAALLSGAERYRAFDLVRYTHLDRMVPILEELVTLFRQRAPVPDESEFPALKPTLPDYRFPRDLLPDEVLERTLAPERVEAIRIATSQVGMVPSMIAYEAPWVDPTTVQASSVDFIFSQAVLEHIDDLDGVYGAMRRWLSPHGVMSHQIDFRCHRKADTWDGHWTYSDTAWKVVVGRRRYLLNRMPHSRHIELLARHGFRVIIDRTTRSPSTLTRRQLSRRFRGLSEDDRTTSGAYIIAVPA